MWKDGQLNARFEVFAPSEKAPTDATRTSLLKATEVRNVGNPEDIPHRREI